MTIPLPAKPRYAIRLDKFGCEAVRRWKGDGVIKQADLVLVQHRKESVSVISCYRLKDGWRELKNNLKEITNTFTSHKPPMSTK